MRIVLSLLVTLLVIGCARVPEIDAVVAQDEAGTDYPELVSLERLFEKTTDPRIDSQSEDALAGRAATLRARAARLRRRSTE
jgi:hypothetical protein